MMPNVFNTTFILIINLIILAYSLWLNKKYFKSFAYISLPFLFNFFITFFYIGIYSYIIYSNNLNNYFGFTRDYTYPFKAILLVTFCNLFFNIGSSLILIKKKKYTIHKFIQKYIKIYKLSTIKKIGIITFVIGVLSKLTYFLILGKGNILYYAQNYFNIQVNSVGSGVGFDFYLRFLFSLIMIGASIIFVHTLITRKNYLTTFIIILVTLIFNFNSRLSILTFLLQILILACLYLKTFRKNIIYYFLLIVLPLFLFILIGLGIYRDSTNNKIHQNIDFLYFALGNIHTVRALSDGLEYNSFNENKYYGMSIIAPILFKPIPRKIWNDKPLNAAAIYTETVSPGVLKQGFAIAPGIIYEAYINFGYLGTLIYFLLFGYLLFFIQIILIKEFLINNLNIFIPTIISFIASRMIYLRGEDFTLIYTYSSFFVIIYILLFLNIKIKNNN